MKTTCLRYLRLALMAGAIVFSSCSFEKETIVTGSDGMAEISFLARMPAATAVTTRVPEITPETGTEEENTIDNIYVLAFETMDGELVYKGKGKYVTPTAASVNNNAVTFKATLPVGKAYDFVVLANADSLLSGITVGADPAVTKADVEALVQQAAVVESVYQKWSGSIPMWDEQELTLSASSSSTVFNLTRMLARVNVKYNPSVPANDHFHLTGVRYYNYNTAGLVVPLAANMTGTGASRYATAPTLPADPGTQFYESLEYATIVNNKECMNRIYVFEAKNQGKYTDANDNWIKNPCLVVGGIYDENKDGNYDEPVSWYRVDFIKTTLGNTPPDEWLDLLRNFSYNVVITSVTGTGYDDPDEALRSAPLNITAGVIDWNDGQMSEIILDGTKFLSIGESRNEGLRRAASLYRNESSTDEIPFSTNIIPLDSIKMAFVPDTYTTWTETPTAGEKAAGVVAKIFHPLYKVHIVQEKVENGVAYGKFVFTAMKTYDPEDPTPTATLKVTSGRIRYDISISQRDASPEDWVDGGNKDGYLGDPPT